MQINNSINQSLLNTAVTTTDNVFTDITNNGQYILVPTNTVINFCANIVGRRTDVLTDGCAFLLEGCIRNFAGTTAIIGTPNLTVLGRTTAAYNANALADDTNDRLQIQVRGQTGHTLLWFSTIYFWSV